LFYKDWTSYYIRDQIPKLYQCRFETWDEGKKCYLCSPGCSPWPAAAWSPVRLGLVRCAPASLYSSYCAARRRPGCLVASTRSGSRRRRHSLLADDVEPGPPPARLVSQSAALCLSPPRGPRALVASDLVRLGLSRLQSQSGQVTPALVKASMY
jgi:hypothetical protein